MEDMDCIRAISGRISLHTAPGTTSRALILQRGLLLLVSILLASGSALAQNGSPVPPSDDQPTLMKVLTDDGLHNTDDENWNAYGQFTYISSWKPSFHAAYTNLNGSMNSLLPGAIQNNLNRVYIQRAKASAQCLPGLYEISRSADTIDLHPHPDRTGLGRIRHNTRYSRI